MFYILALFFYILILLLNFMPKITYKDISGNSKTLEVEKGLTVMEELYKTTCLESMQIVEDQWHVQLAMFMSKKNG